MSDLLVEYRKPAALTPSPRNPPTHSKRWIRQIADTIRTFGFTNPVLIDDDGIIAGHGRVEAAKLVGHGCVPTIRLSAMTEAQKRAYVIADNKLALVADAIQDCSRRNGIVLDCFLGSGTPLVAAERTGRQGVGIELDPRYVDVALQRLATLADLEAIHQATGMTFAAVRAHRLSGETSDVG